MTTLNLTADGRPTSRRLDLSPSAELLGMIRADATAAEARANFGEAVFARMLDEGLFHMLVPPELRRRWRHTPPVVRRRPPRRPYRRLGGWILAQGAVQNAWLAVAADGRFAADYFATRQTIATSGAGRVVAEFVDDAYVVHGARWQYVSPDPRRLRRRHGRRQWARRNARDLRPTRRGGHHPTDVGHPRAAGHSKQRHRLR